jgi:hypothetical protein
VDGEAVPGGEGESVGVVGVSCDVEVAVVVGVVVVGAQAGEVEGVGGAAVGPVDQVVALDVGGGGAAGEAAAAVAVFDQASGAGRDDALGAADVDGCALGVPDGLQDPVAGQLGGQVGREAGLAGEPGAFGVEVDVGAERVPAVD